MKEIIYLNTDFIHSFMAQKFSGLPLNNTKEQSQQDSQTSSDTTKNASTHEAQGEVNSGSIKVPFIVAAPSGKVSYKYNNQRQSEETVSLTQIDAGKEIISKQLHDNALDDFEAHLNENSKLNVISIDGNGEEYIGEYVKIVSTFTLFDLDHLKSLTAPEIMREMMLLGDDVIAEKNRKGHVVGKKLDAKVEYGIKSFDVILRYLSSILPTQLFLKQGKFISPLKSDFLRESSKELNFKYGENCEIEVTVLGRVTKLFDSFNAAIFEEGAQLKELTSAIDTVTDVVLSQVKSIKKGDLIISPVAIYFE